MMETVEAGVQMRDVQVKDTVGRMTAYVQYCHPFFLSLYTASRPRGHSRQGRPSSENQTEN